MSHNFVAGDFVRIGNGKVEYEVFAVRENDMDLRSMNTGNMRYEVQGEKVSMVKAMNVIGGHASVESIEAAITNGENALKAAKLLSSEVAASASKGLTLILDGHVKKVYRSRKSFQKAAFDLSRLSGTYTCAWIAFDGEVLVKRVA